MEQESTDANITRVSAQENVGSVATQSTMSHCAARSTRDDKMQVTPKQNEYLLELDNGPKLSREFNNPTARAYKMLCKLRSAGLVEATISNERKNEYSYSLAIPYTEMVENGLKISDGVSKRTIPDEEILYAATLRNAGLTGQRLTAIFNRKYPNRSKHGIKNIINKARNNRWCR